MLDPKLKAALEQIILETNTDVQIQEDLMGHGEWLPTIDGHEYVISGPIKTSRGAAWEIYKEGDDDTPMARFIVKRVEIEELPTTDIDQITRNTPEYK